MGQADRSWFMVAADGLKKCVVNSIDVVRLREDIVAAAPKPASETALRIM